MDPKELEAKVAELTQQLAAMTAQVEATKTSAATHESRVAAYRSALVNVHSTTLLSGLIDPELAKLAPAIEVDDTGNPVADSLTAVHAWRASKAHFFKVEETKPVVQPTTSTAPVVPTTTPSVPPVNVAGNEWSWEKWDAMKKDNPIEYEKRQPELIAWCNSMAKAGK